MSSSTASSRAINSSRSKPGEGNRTAGTRRGPRRHARPAGNRAKPGRGLPRRDYLVIAINGSQDTILEDL